MCPECGGPFRHDNPRGWLTCDHAPSCSLGAAEDATAAADHERTATRRTFTRPVTEAERTLAAHLGIPLGDVMTVRRTTDGGGVVRRSWPFRWEVTS